MDDLFRDKLYHHSTEAPMHLWETMDARLSAGAKSTKRRWALWWGTGATLFLGLAALLLYLVTNKEGTTVPAEPQEFVPKQANESAAVAATATEKIKTAQQLEAVPMEQIKKAGHASMEQGDETEKATASLALAAASIKGANPSTELITPLKTETDSAWPTTSSVASAALQPTDSQEPIEADALGNFAPLSGATKLLDYEPNLGLDGGGPLNLSRPRGWRVYGEVLAALDLPSRSLSAREPEFEAYRLAREQSETVQHGQRATLRFSMISVDGFAVRSGLSYGQHREQLSLPQQNRMNRFSTVDIPVVLGYERNNMGKFTLSANAGVYLNMAFSQQGQFLAPDLNQILDFSSKTPDAYPAFKNRLGAAWYASLAASYPLTPRLRLVVEPYLLRHSGSFTTADYAIDQQYQNWGIQLGLRKKINKYIYFARP